MKEEKLSFQNPIPKFRLEPETYPFELWTVGILEKFRILSKINGYNIQSFEFATLTQIILASYM